MRAWAEIYKLSFLLQSQFKRKHDCTTHHNFVEWEHDSNHFFASYRDSAASQYR